MGTSVASKISKRKPLKPSAADLNRKTAELTRRYQIVVRWDDVDECYAGQCVKMPNAVGFGDTEPECIAETRGNIEALIWYTLSIGEKPPLVDEPKRTIRVDLPFSESEKVAVQTPADAAGKSLPDDLRSAALRGG